METAVGFPGRGALTLEMKKLIKNGDILFRLSDARGPFNLPFMKLVAKATKSEFTHAAIAYWDGGELYVMEATDIGMMVYRFVDWLAFCIDEKFQVWRSKNGLLDFEETILMQEIKRIADLDPDYDFNFNDQDKFYCTELVAYLYAKIGTPLQFPKLIEEVVGKTMARVIMGLNSVYSWLTKGKVALPVDGRFFYVGNRENGGLMSSNWISMVYEHGR